MNTETLDYQLDGVPAELAERVRNNAKIRELLLKEKATGIRLVRMEGGWSNSRDEKLKSDEAYEVQVLGRPGKENDTQYGSWGTCYVKFDGQWGTTNISQC